MAKEVVVTREGYNKLEQELENLRTVKRKEVADKIKVARGYGDLSENAEYDEAKNEEARVNGRIAQLEELLKEYAAASRGNARSEANGQVFYLDIVLPHRGSREIARILPTLFSALHGSGNVLRPVSLTNNQPSLMNGGKDF